MRTNFQNPDRGLAIARTAMVATSHSLASSAALTCFARGGNAMDAALTAVIVQGVVDPAMTGIGGDCFCLVGQDGEAIAGYNGSGRTPARANLKDLAGQAPARDSAAALTIPGAVEAWGALHGRYGVLPWAELFSAAIAYAADGFPVLERVAHDWASEATVLNASQSARAAYLRADGTAPGVGDMWHLPALANTLESLADQGPKAFYEGPAAQTMVDTAHALGGKHTLADFSDHHGDWIMPISTAYAGTHIWECPPNGQGLVALIAFAVLEAARTSGLMTSRDPFNPDRVEWQLRALSAGYEVRDQLIADPGQDPDLAARALAPSHVQRLLTQVQAQIHAKAPLYAQPYSQPHRDTVYVAARDESGLSVSLINSIFNAFGSGHVAGDTGILLHSRGQSFCADAAHPNAYGPAKRPMHTIIPALATRDGSVETVFGVMGAHYQPQGQVHVYTAMHDCGLSAQAAQDLPRWFANPEGFVELEKTVPAELGKALEQRFGSVRYTDEPHGGSQIITVKDGLMFAGTDPRKDGAALGL